MDLSRLTNEGKGFFVRVTDLRSESPAFLQTELMIYAKFVRQGRELQLTLHKLTADWINYVRESEPSYKSLHPLEDVVLSDDLYEDRHCFEKDEAGNERDPPFDCVLDSIQVNVNSATKLGYTALMVQGSSGSSAKRYVLHFNRMSTCEQAVDIIQRARVETSGEFLNFEHCAFLFNQRLFLNDERRLGLYSEIFRRNMQDFKDKVVLDVGCGVGILSIFALRAGAQQVYAVDPVAEAVHTANVATANDHGGHVKVFRARVESVELPSKVDTIVCDCFGEMLLHGQTLKSLLIAKQRFLKPDGKIYPTKGTLIMRPSDISEYDTMIRQNVWTWARNVENQGLFSARLLEDAIKESRYHPILKTNTEDRALAISHKQTFDFATMTPEDLLRIQFPFSFTFLKGGNMKAFTFTFRLSFIGSESQDSLNAECVDGVPTRWPNVFCLLPDPYFVRGREQVGGTCLLLANDFHSYDLEIKFDFRRKHYECKYRLEYGSSIARNL